MTSIDKIEEILKSGGIENYRQEANWIVRFGNHPGTSCHPSKEGNYEEIARRRVSGEPLQYLLGEWEFYGYPFKVGRGVLIPRPETELLVDIVMQNSECRMQKYLVYDLCAGSGCVGIALAKEIGCRVIAVEKSEEAIAYLKKNVALNGVGELVQIIQGDVLNPDFVEKQLRILHSAFCIVINPPYLSKAEMDSLQKEVRFEPEMALFGGEDGLDFYRELYRLWGGRARLFACEVGDGQAEQVLEFMPVGSRVVRDFNGIDRVVYAVV